MKYKWSMYCLRQKTRDGVIIKSTLTGAVVHLSDGVLGKIDRWLEDHESEESELLDCLRGENGLIVSAGEKEIGTYEKLVEGALISENTFFTLHLLPTLKCQLECSYCFEGGIAEKGSMSKRTLHQTANWMSRYFEVNSGLDALRLVYFGGEPLLRKDIIRISLPLFHDMAERSGKEFFCEIITNGELFDEDIARLLSKHNWHRAQITLDGDRETHNRRRFGEKGRPTFDRIVSNISMLLNGNYIEKVDLRINFDSENAESVLRLIDYLADTGYQKRVSLSFAIVNTIAGGVCSSGECKVLQNTMNQVLSGKYLEFCDHSRKAGFEVPEELTAGPLCIATLRHSAVVQPDGSLQKCFCSVGRSAYNFGHVSLPPVGHAQDKRFEMHFERTISCKSEKCSYLPVCGGGCVWDSVSLHGNEGFKRPFCQKDLLSLINQGLLRSNYGD